MACIFHHIAVAIVLLASEGQERRHRHQNVMPATLSHARVPSVSQRFASGLAVAVHQREFDEEFRAFLTARLDHLDSHPDHRSPAARPRSMPRYRPTVADMPPPSLLNTLAFVLPRLAVLIGAVLILRWVQ